jgi:hypothetical protein
MDLKEISWDEVDWINRAQDMGGVSCEYDRYVRCDTSLD